MFVMTSLPTAHCSTFTFLPLQWGVLVGEEIAVKEA